MTLQVSINEWLNIYFSTVHILCLTEFNNAAFQGIKMTCKTQSFTFNINI